MLRMNPLEQKKTCFTPTYCQIYHDSCRFFFGQTNAKCSNDDYSWGWFGQKYCNSYLEGSGKGI